MNTTLSARKVIGMLQKAMFRNQWRLMFDLSSALSTSFCAFKEIVPPRDRFWADPLVIQADGYYYIFIEEYLYKDRKGHIAVIQMDEEGHWNDPIRVLEKDYHLSFPFVFEWENKFYMVPESAQNKTIELYECVEFPCKWKFKMNLMENVSAVDTALFHYREKWWLFTGLAEREELLPFVQLFLFFSPDLFTGNWTPHPLNPIRSDATKARAAGKVFINDERILRSSQDCSKMYGYGFDLVEILLLSESEYLERDRLAARPGWNKKIRAMHTFSREGQLTIIDALTRNRRFF